MNGPSIDPPESVDTLARTMWGEARGCGVAGMHAVANTVVNRADHPRWWGHDVMSVCRDPWQYSCWNAGGPNLPKMLAVTNADPQFAEALKLAYAAVARDLPDLTGGADSYYARSMTTPPAWAARAVHTFSDAWHNFYRVELPAPSGGPEAPNVSVHSASDETAGERAADALMDKYDPPAPSAGV